MTLLAATAVRTKLKITKSNANTLIAMLAFDDISDRRRLRHQWTHPQTAAFMGTDPNLLNLIQAYLEYRRAPRDTKRVISMTETGANARLYAVGSPSPLDLISLPPGLDKIVKVRAVLVHALNRKVSVSHELTKDAERLIGQECGRSWDALEELYVHHRAAMKETS